ncbi:hypothetical protein C8Q77DRAFT_1205336 [Trametes polyzona]|nr:hypothetical protein C8Q77DRAFT_1205336 [Trametes polyzona]
MSAREPLWYCHECHAEMRPLMVPDPHCASCNGTFVEKIENPADDPREFQLADGGHWDDGALPGNMDAFLGAWACHVPHDDVDCRAAGLQNILRGPVLPPQPSSPSSTSSGRAPSPEARRSSTEGYRRASTGSTDQQRSTTRNGPFTIRIERSSAPGGQTRTFVLGGSSAAGSDEIPRLSQFTPRNPDGTQQDRPNITGAMLAQYLLALMGPGRAGDPFSEFLGGMFGPAGMPPGSAESGRWGDYVFNQEALDQIISQIMENSNAHQPVPASEEAMEKLPREVLEEGSPLLEKDCAVCKEQFKLDSEDPDDLVVITLPCHHPFHENCILPWLKNSGTCPVCRYQLTPQPDSHPPGSGPSQAGSSSAGGSSGSRGGNGGGDNNRGGLLQNMFNLFYGQQGSSSGGSQASGSNSGNANGSTSTSSSSAPHTNSGNAPSSSSESSGRPQQGGRRETEGHLDVPGGWGDEID